jgi:type I restriction enzyme S subunit
LIWEEHRLADVLDLIGGGTPKTTNPDYWNGDVPWLSVADFNTGQRKVYDSEKSVTRKALEDRKTGILKSGQLIISARGTVGVVAQVGRDMAFNQSCYGINARLDVATNDFLYYLLKHTVNKLKQVSHGGIFDTITRSTFEQISVSLPPFEEQQAIASILGSLDDKIELNRRMNETLEALARALFKSWFVDFDPVRAKMEGRQPAGMDDETAALFPDSFEDSALGEIPKGWKADSFSEIIELTGGGTPKTSVDEYWNGEIPWFSVVDAPKDSDVFVVDTEKHVTKAGVANSSTKVLPVGTTIISARGTVGRCALVSQPMTMNQSCYGIKGLDERGDYFAYFATRRMVTELQQHAHGSVFSTITRNTFRRVKIAIPPPDLIPFRAIDVTTPPRPLPTRSNQ